MDKEFIIDVLKCLKSSQFSEDKITKVLADYCVLEHNKSVTDTNNFINAIISNPIIAFSCLEIALDYYKRKFNISVLYSKERELLLIF